MHSVRMQPTDMVLGTRYSVRYRAENMRYDRVAVMDFLGLSPKLAVFSERPYAGTVYLPTDWIRSIRPVPAGTDIALEHRAGVGD